MTETTKPKISIIIPVFNAEKYLESTLETVFHQTYRNLEILLVDDGSTDRSGEICQAYAHKDPIFRYIRQDNAGAGAARNKGIELATAEYIVFMDADDRIDADYIEKMAAPVIAGKADFSVCDIDNIDVSAQKHNISRIRIPYGVITSKEDKNLISKIRTFCWGKLYKKSLWTENHIRFPEGELYRALPGFEDVCCIPLLAVYADRVAHVEDCVYHYYRGHENSLMHEARFEYFYNSQEELLRSFVGRGISAEYHLALRKFILGQFVSANRWRLTSKEIGRMWGLIEVHFPEIAGARHRKVCVQDQLQYDVLKHVFFDRGALAESPPDQVNMLQIEINDSEICNPLDYETYCYDKADEIIDHLPEML